MTIDQKLDVLWLACIGAMVAIVVIAVVLS